MSKAWLNLIGSEIWTSSKYKKKHKKGLRSINWKLLLVKSLVIEHHLICPGGFDSYYIFLRSD